MDIVYNGVYSDLHGICYKAMEIRILLHEIMIEYGYCYILDNAKRGSSSGLSKSLEKYFLAHDGT